MTKTWLILFSLSCLATINCQEESTIPQDVLDTAAWAANWIVSVGSYASRQVRPNRRPHGWHTLEDLPKIYIPNELTGNEIVRALKLTGKKQMILEKNELLKYLDFHLMRHDATSDFDDDEAQNVTVYSVNGTEYEIYEDEEPARNDNGFAQYFDEDDTGENFVLSESLITRADEFLSQYPLGDDTIEAVTEILGNVSFTKGHDTWISMVAEVNNQYQNMMSILEEKDLFVKVKDEDDIDYADYGILHEFNGLYAITKSGSEMVFPVVNATVLQSMVRRYFPNKDTNYVEYKKYKEFIEQVENTIGAAASSIRLPSEISWENIKLTFQKMYKQAIPQIHLFQFLTRRTLDYLEVDTDIRGMSKLSDYVTQQLVDAMWDTLGCSHPLNQCPKPPPPPRECKDGRRRINLERQEEATITSPGYPSNYDNNYELCWTIRAPLGSMIKLEFLDFNLEVEADCDYDFVVVHDGSNRFAGQLGPKACGTTSGGPHVSTSNRMFVKFKTDGSTTRPGFRARITKV